MYTAEPNEAMTLVRLHVDGEKNPPDFVLPHRKRGGRRGGREERRPPAPECCTRYIKLFKTFLCQEEREPISSFLSEEKKREGGRTETKS